MRKDQLKRRLVGAVVLVSLAVIFIPMMLDSRTVEENLGAAIPSRDTGPFDEQLARQTPTPIERTSGPAAVDPNVLPATAAGVPKADSPEPQVAAQRPDLHAWVVQLGSFGERANADGLAAKLRAAGFDTVIEQARVDGQSVYRVQVGPEATEAAAEQTRQRIADKLKLDGKVHRHPAG